MEGNPNSNILGYFQKTQNLFKIGIMENGRKSKEYYDISERLEQKTQNLFKIGIIKNERKSKES